MCVTEIWSYRECGCFYNHKILCRSYRREQTPCCAPKIQYPLDKWLEETAVAPDGSHPLPRPRAMPLEREDCPNHRVVEKSFLNQICEDCLLAELDGLPSSLSTSDSAQDFPNANLDNGEGLIWDSEVKIEIEDSNSGSSASPSVAVPSVQSQEAVDENRMILESHVEITIEDEHHNIFTRSATSPELIAYQQTGQSQPSLIQPLSSSSLHGDLCRANSRASGSKRYGRAFQEINVAGFDHACTIDGTNTLSFNPFPQPPFRKRSLMICSNLHRTQVRKPEADSTPGPAKERSGIRGLPKFQSLKSLSTSVRVAPRPLMVCPEHCINSGTGPACSSSSLGSSSKNPFRWKGSTRIGETSGSMCGSFEHRGRIPHPKAQDTPTIPPRKSSLKNLALFLLEDFTRTKAMVLPRLGSRSRRLTLSPTSSWLRKHAEPSEEIDSSTQGSVSHSETTFESASGASSLEATGARGMKTEKGFLIPSIPKSSTMNTMRAIINGYMDQDVRLDDQDEAARQPPLSRTGDGHQGQEAGDTGMSGIHMLEDCAQQQVAPPGTP